MSTALASPEVSTPPAALRITWTPVDRGFSVASRDGEYVGCMDEVAGEFVVRDGRNAVIGRHRTAEEARAALRAVVEGGTAGTDERDEMWRRTAAVAAVVAGSVLLTAGVLAPWL